MCGISGMVVETQVETPPADLVCIVDSQSARGPDSVGYRRFGIGDGRSLWLAHNRLSIIDLSSAGNQPFTAESGRYAMVFNGAIYNYLEIRRELEAVGRSFRSSSDTEVLLEAYAQWGERAFEKFLGMFAVAIYDSESRRLTLARDRFGVKPLYFSRIGGGLCFASNPTQIAVTRRFPVNLEYVARGIKYKYYDDETTISPYLNIESLPAGHVAHCDLATGDCAVRQYFDFYSYCQHEQERLAGVDENAATEELRFLLMEATKIRLRADVKIGLSLSGGVDSASVAYLCRELGDVPQAYSFGSPEDNYSEASLVLRLSKSFDMPVAFVGQCGGFSAESLFWRTMRAQGAPFPHTSQLAQYAVFEAARAGGVKVMLGGQGGDEAFMGYRKYFLYHARFALANRQWSETKAVLVNSLMALPSILERASVFWSERHRYLDNSDRGQGASLLLPALTHSRRPGVGLGGSPTLRQILDVTTFSLPSLLRYEDRNSMGNSIESRLPFLDHRVMGFGIGLPLNTKLRHGFGKYALRQAMRDGVPRDVIFNRQKRGFDTRHADWISSGVGRAIRQGFEQQRSYVQSYLPSGVGMGEYFSDRQLSTVAGRFAEATSLLWMADSSLESYPSGII